FAWAATTVLVAFYLLLLYKSHLITMKVAAPKESERLTSFARILSFQFLAILPVCAVHWDYGRVIFSWATSSISAFLVLTPSKQLAINSLISDTISLLPRSARHAFGIIRRAYNHALSSAFVTSRRLTLVKFSLLLFGIPTCCWSVVQ